MSYLLAQILVCLLIAGLIGALIGWWFRGGCRKKLREIDNDWSARYDADKALWQGKIDVAENHVEKSVYQNNNEWDLRLRDAESNWEGKVQGLVGNYDVEISNLNLERQALEDELLAARADVKESRTQLTSTDEKWNLKLKDIETNWEGKVQGLVSNYDSKAGNSDKELEALRAELKLSKTELSDSNNSWNLKLKDVESSWEGKLQGVVSDYDSNAGSSDAELEALKSELKLAKTELSDVNDSWSLKLKDSKSTWEAKTQTLVSSYDSKSGDNNQELEALRAEVKLAKSDVAKAELKVSQSNDEWNFKLKDIESSWEGKVQGLVSDYDSKSGSSDTELEALRLELATTKTELTTSNDSWNLKLKDVESSWAGKVQGLVSDYDSKSGSSDGELKALKTELSTVKAELSDSNDSWNLKLKDVESSWEGKLQGVVSDYDSKSGSSDGELKALQDKLASAEMKLTDVNDSWGVKLKDSQSNWEGKVQALVSDHDSKVGSSEKEVKALKDELAAAQAEAKHSQKKLTDSSNEWKLKLESSESNWSTKMQGLVSDYDSKIGEADKERQSLKTSLNLVQAEADDAKAELFSADQELFGAIGNLEDSYDVTEIEGIGPGYGKKFNAMGINTTVDFANRFLNQKDATKKAANETKIDFDAIRAWASMADLMRLPGVDGQYAEIMQVVGVDSRDELTKLNAKQLHSKMTEYNTSNPIVPEVPELALILKWMKAPDGAKIAAALEKVPTTANDMNECYEVEEIEGIGPAYGKKFRNMGINTTCDFAKAYLNDDNAAKKAAQETGIDVAAIQAWASMSDIMRLPGVDGQYAEIMQAVGVSSKEDLSKFNAQTLHDKMTKFNATNAIVPEVPSLDLISQWAKNPDSATIDSSNTGTSSSEDDMNECYEIEEVEGIGPGYGKKFRNMGVNTTCDLANKFLRDNGATKKASKQMKVDFDAVRAWACMADLMRIPGVSGQYAEIIQTVGVSSRKELTQMSVNSLQSKMAEFNAKNPIVPEVPTVDMLVSWATAAKKQKH